MVDDISDNTMKIINKNIMWIVGILLIGSVVCAVLVARPQVTKPSFTSNFTEFVELNDTWNLDCDGNNLQFIWNIGSEQQYTINDIELMAMLSCNGTATNMKRNGDFLLINEYGDIGFDEDVLKGLSCARNEKAIVYDSKTGECVA